MKLLIALLLFSNLCLAQQLVVKNEQQQPLEGVSVFLSDKTNKLIGISDSLGTLRIDIKKDSTYLFHLLGYDDLLVQASKFQKSNVVVLKSVNYKLDQVSVKNSSFKHRKFISRPGDFNFGAQNGIPAIAQFVTTITLEKAGFLNVFKLFAYQPVKGEPKKYKFILFKNDLGKPGEQILTESVEGALRNNSRLVFDLAQSSPYLEAGTYFMGYETLNNESRLIDAKVPNTYIMIKGKTIDVPKMYGRWNLKEWRPTRIVIPAIGKFTDMGYELEMDVIN
jgi:hypothetical protein